MRTGVGVGIVVGAGALGLLVLARWHRLSEGVARALAAALGATVGAGVLLLQEDPGAADWVVTVGVLAAFTPLHVRMLAGRPGAAP